MNGWIIIFRKWYFTLFLISGKTRQRCVLNKLCDACGPEFAARFGPIAAKPIRYVREGIKDFNCIICDKNQDLLSYFRLVHAKNKPRDERICCNAFEYRLSMRDKSLWRPPVFQQRPPETLKSQTYYPYTVKLGNKELFGGPKIDP